jgi:RNA polymerase sigma-70 factor (ECF subfamily)
MVNIRIDQIRAAVNEHAVDDVTALESIPDHEWTRRVEASVTLDEVARAMRRLPEPMREVLALVTIDGMSYRDAAAVLDLPLGTVMSRLARARTELMRLLGFRGDETDAADGVAL